MHLNKKRQIKNEDSMMGSFLGPRYTKEKIKKFLKLVGARFDELGTEEMINNTALAISKGKAIGWFQGNMEFGPRSLGSRSILADPRNKEMQKNLNLKIKYRESFRPFAPSILEEDVNSWFDLDCKSPYMLLVDNVKKSKLLKNKTKKSLDINAVRSKIPAVTHVDNTARIQTVSKKTNNIFYKLILKFKDLTNVPILVNTSFNIRGEPIVCTPEDAFRCFMGTNLDILVIENFFWKKLNKTKIWLRITKKNLN